MAGLSEQKIEIVRTLVRSAPDRVVGGLQAALMHAAGDPTLSSVRLLVEVELADRKLRNAVLAPIAPLCVGDGSAEGILRFPAGVLGAIWRGLRAQCPHEVEIAAALLLDYRANETSADPLDDLVRRAAAGLRSGEHRDFRRALDLADAARPGGGGELCACLDLAPIVREATHKLPDWIGRSSEERSAAARLAFKDAVEISEDAGPRFFEMLAGQLPKPWMILRIISAVMDRPSEAYLAATDLAVFALRVMDDIDRGLGEVRHLDPDAGVEAALGLAKTVELLTLQAHQLDESIELTRESAWGKRVAEQKKALASVVENRLREAEKAMLAALPRHPVRVARAMKDLPRLNTPPDPAATARAVTLLSFVEEIRNSANYGGFASMRAKLLEKLGEALDAYVEEVLELMRRNEVEDVEIAYSFLDQAATFGGLVRDKRAGDIIRRRSAAARASAAAEDEDEDEAL